MRGCGPENVDGLNRGEVSIVEVAVMITDPVSSEAIKYGWQPQMALRQGIEHTVEWFRRTAFD